MKKIKRIAFGTIILALAGGSAAQAQEAINIGCTAATDCAAAAVAVYDGIFARNGLDAKMTLININSNIPAALIADSIQFGAPTTPTFILAVNGGLELAAVAGASSTSQTTYKMTAVVASTAAGVKSPTDFSGKTVGVPGLNAFNHLLFVKWLIDNGVDPKSVKFVEVPFLAMGDALKAHSVDAVLTDEPLLSRMVKDGAGEVAGYFLKDIPDGMPVMLYASSTDWASAHPDTVEAFRKSIAEAAKLANENPDKAREAMSKFTGIPMEVMAEEVVAFNDPDMRQESIDWWVNTMVELGQLKQGALDASSLLQK